MPPSGVMAPSGQPAPPGGGVIQQNAYVTPGPTNPSAPSGNAPAVYLEQPQPIASAPNTSASPRQAQSFAPQTPESRQAQSQSPQTPEPPPARDDRAASPALPVDIPHFAMVKTNLASGQEPFAEGIAWLKAHGYRTVLHVRAPGEDDRAARQFEQSGLRYLSLEVSPQTLSKDIADHFNGMVGDAGNLPLFVYDKDGALAGALWYVHFRLVDRQTEEQARQNAERLGFKPDSSDPRFKTMWLAVQKLLKDLGN
jgi:protein tyrosine phosphatase (PTP) superfamily phosphohydrolase (DUF442 family)